MFSNIFKDVERFWSIFKFSKVGCVCLLCGCQCWKWRPYKLGWVISWLNGIGGFLFFVSCAVFTWWDNGDADRETFRLWLCAGPLLVGSVLYWIGSVLSLVMWKLQQFGLVNLPFLNKQKRRDYIERNLEQKDKVLYRDILFLILYSLDVAMAFIAISYALQCEKYEDWIKNFLLGSLASIALLSLGSFMHQTPKKPPFLYFIWFIRCYFVFYTSNLAIDLWHISGSQCAKYGAWRLTDWLSLRVHCWVLSLPQSHSLSLCGYEWMRRKGAREGATEWNAVHGVKGSASGGHLVSVSMMWSRLEEGWSCQFALNRKIVFVAMDRKIGKI